jgi:hypothetical protein
MIEATDDPVDQINRSPGRSPAAASRPAARRVAASNSSADHQAPERWGMPAEEEGPVFDPASNNTGALGASPQRAAQARSKVPDVSRSSASSRLPDGR